MRIFIRQNVGSCNCLQPPQYLIIIVNQFDNNNNNNGIMTKNKTLISVDQHIISGQFIYHLHAIIDHHGQLLGSGYYTASVARCNDVYYCNDNRITVYDIGSIRDSPTVYIMMYKLYKNV